MVGKFAVRNSFFGLVPANVDSPNFWYFILLLGTVLYRNHMVPDRQGSAAHEIPDHWISPTLAPFFPKLPVKCTNFFKLTAITLELKQSIIGWRIWYDKDNCDFVFHDPEKIDSPQQNIPLAHQQKFQVRPKREKDYQVLFVKFKPGKSNLKAYRTLLRFFLNANQQKHTPSSLTMYVNHLPKAVHDKLMLCQKKNMSASPDVTIPFSRPNLIGTVSSTAVPIQFSKQDPNATPVPITTPVPTATKTLPIFKPTTSTQRIFMDTKPTERNPIPVSIPASLPHVIKNCNGKSEFFFKEMIFFNFFFHFWKIWYS